MYEIYLNDFDLREIAESGQCFRINEIKRNHFSIVAQGKLLIVDYLGLDVDKGDLYRFHCSEEQFKKRWHRYFNLDMDYGEIKCTATHRYLDKMVTSAIGYAPGIRVLRQEPWEMIVSYIISQRKNILAIKNSIEKICKKYENLIGEYKGKEYYSFPSPYSILSGGIEGLKETGVGYRDEYIIGVAEAVIDGRLDIASLQQMNYSDSISYLKQFKGIGEKVSNCIALYGLHHLKAVPKDKWILQLIKEDYNGNTPQWFNSKYAGAIQQYVFFYKRSTNKKGVNDGKH